MLHKEPEYYAEKYKHTFMDMAASFGSVSNSKRASVGCLIYLNDHTLSVGVNGMPSLSDTEVCEEDGVTKPEVRHAEIAAVDKLLETGLEDKLKGSIVFLTLSPCVSCGKVLKKYGVSKIYYKEHYRCIRSFEELEEVGIKLIKLERE